MCFLRGPAGGRRLAAVLPRPRRRAMPPSRAPRGTCRSLLSTRSIARRPRTRSRDSSVRSLAARYAHGRTVETKVAAPPMARSKDRIGRRRHHPEQRTTRTLVSGFRAVGQRDLFFAIDEDSVRGPNTVVSSRRLADRRARTRGCFLVSEANITFHIDNLRS